MKAGEETRLGQFFPASLFFAVVVIFAFTLNISSAQSFNQILSAKHVQKIENAGSARDKIKQYKRLYSKDSLRQLKEAERYWKRKSDSLFALKENYDTLQLKPDTLMLSEYLEKYDSAQLDSIRNLAISRIKSEVENSEYGQRVNAIQDKYLTAIKNDSLLKEARDQLTQKVQSEFGQLSQASELEGQLHQYKNYDPWDNEYKAKVDQLADMTYTRGFIDVIQNKANIQFDRLTLSPRFIEKMDAFTGDRLNNVTGEMEDDETAHGYITKQGGGDSFNENGASFISYLDRNSRKTFLHESLHGVFNRIAGRGNSWFDSKIFGSYYLDHDKRYYESVIAPYVGRLFPR